MFDAVTKPQWFPNAEGSGFWGRISDEIRRVGSGMEYDCILGLSGGVDSSYLALKARKWGLRPLVVHVDAGWNSELAVSNIESIVKHCGYDLHTHVVDWEESLIKMYRRITFSFLRFITSQRVTIFVTY
jgi:tRNA(Ile)-lysidine synthase TilS/MesJ